MLTKELIDTIKQTAKLYPFLANTKDNKEILFILENLGRLPNHFDGDCLVPLAQNTSDQIRLWTVKNLGKLKTEKYLDLLKEIAQNDTDSMVRPCLRLDG